MLVKADLVRAVRGLSIDEREDSEVVVDTVLKTMLDKTPSGWLKACVREIMEPRDAA